MQAAAIVATRLCGCQVGFLISTPYRRRNGSHVWNAFWSSLVRPENLIEEVCHRKLRGNVRMITEADVRAARILSPQRVGEDVCNGVATVPTR